MATFSVSRMSFLKLLELLLTGACVGLHYHSFNGGDVEYSMVCAGTYVGYLVLLLGVFGGYIMKTPISKRVDIFYSVCGVALFIYAGVLAIKRYENWSKGETRDIGLAKGSLSIVAAAAFLLDAIFSFRNE